MRLKHRTDADGPASGWAEQSKVNEVNNAYKSVRGRSIGTTAVIHIKWWAIDCLASTVLSCSTSPLFYRIVFGNQTYLKFVHDPAVGESGVVSDSGKVISAPIGVSLW
mmetsp:Transcript_7769/g.16227  ORF Transcript_7769/g.16227 Transcript_7769/m.16227 type:complete len:108 (+) Transcript_7769:271-594(+)